MSVFQWKQASALLCLLPLLLLGSCGDAQPKTPPLVGVWLFDDTVPDFPGVRMIEIYASGKGYQGTMTTRWYGPMPMKQLKITGDSATFEIFNGNARVPATTWRARLLQGKLHVNGEVWYGKLDHDAVRGTAADVEARHFTLTSLPEYAELPPDGLALTPPMGWSSWNKFAEHIDDKTVREIADAMVSSGLRDAGYVYVNIDDGWQGTRAADGSIQANERFPDMKALADYVHSKGLKLGIYSSPGPKTCAGYEGSYGHVAQDAQTYASWGIDYLKYDLCSGEAFYQTGAQIRASYQEMGQALRATGRAIVYSLCEYGRADVGSWGRSVGGHLWRTTGDITDEYEVMARLGFELNGKPQHAGAGGWNDPDMLEVGNGGMTHDEYQTYMTLWAMSAAPLLMGHDVRHMSAATVALLENPEVIAIDQDVLGAQGQSVRKDGDSEIWRKPLADGSVAVALFNRGAQSKTMTLTVADSGLSAWQSGRDLWQQQEVILQPQLTFTVAAHGSQLLRLQGQQ
ncbi:glycoside hydrolase family 27 protein [Shewanella dokdonensis]|uniref:Alpha-galactosidase n=1 Tax=Shewanella dokdonensis TaxID=712036 RepID=A0ABX8DJA6_9GAMM|nr:glycoside hydrolase family 27 protein [Shewanella dokdonensis]MCL1074320.1 glycoside hydrolase family 27 protein [Shewanella dokdonensis]QVK24012.1 glycoside hydrolase family 27 protein [Shewanella dokdonensis]